MTLEVVYAYTNLTFTDKMKEDPFKLYDILISTGIFEDVLKAISQNDWDEIQNGTWDTIENIYNYKNSAMGILENISNDYGNVSMDSDEIYQKLADPENMELLRGVLNKLG